LNERNHVIIKGAGVDETVFLEKKNSVLKGKIRIVFLARMLKDKGVFEFIKAANMLRARYSDIIEFVLVGGIDIFNPSFVSEVQLISLTDSTYLIWLGHQENVKKIYESADIVCLPSYREGLPKSLVEAMAVGCPIITTDAIGCRECVDNGVNGFLVPVGDYEILAQRIEELVLDKELRIKMGHKSREKMIKEMSLSKVIKMTFDFYEQ
jgi:glycosyltransferase involved in cell wall biosynthesis